MEVIKNRGKSESTTEIKRDFQQHESGCRYRHESGVVVENTRKYQKHQKILENTTTTTTSTSTSTTTSTTTTTTTSTTTTSTRTRTSQTTKQQQLQQKQIFGSRASTP